MRIWDFVFDNHMHLREDGFNTEAAKQFEKRGGTAFNLVNLPDYRLPPSDYYESVYERTMRMAERVRSETSVSVLITIGPYPLDYLHFSPFVDDVEEFMRKGVDLAFKLIESGKANAIGEIGRPHFETSSETVEKANNLLHYAMSGAADIGTPVILHTEDLNGAAYSALAEMAKRTGLKPNKLVKHHAHPVDLNEDDRVVKSILATRKNVRESLSSGEVFMLETDYVDDIAKPGKVIPADSVPKRAEMIKNEYENWQDILESLFRGVPFAVYEDDIFR